MGHSAAAIARPHLSSRAHTSHLVCLTLPQPLPPPLSFPPNPWPPMHVPLLWQEVASQFVGEMFAAIAADWKNERGGFAHMTRLCQTPAGINEQVCAYTFVCICCSKKVNTFYSERTHSKSEMTLGRHQRGGVCMKSCMLQLLNPSHPASAAVCLNCSMHQLV